MTSSRCFRAAITSLHLSAQSTSRRPHEVNAQIGEIDEIVKSYDPNALVIGEAPMMKDLEDVTNVDLVNVNTLSIAAIFVIIMLTFKSISLPIILVSVIEFAIMVNMAVPYYHGS